MTTTPESLLQPKISKISYLHYPAKRKTNNYQILLTPNQIQGISVVVPTFQRVTLCQKLLASLQDSQQHLHAPVEIILVDNSPLPEAKQIKALCSEYGARFYSRKLGVGAKRNFGARIASYPLILFIDSDCEATPTLLKEHLELYQKNQQIVAVIGQTKFRGPKSFIWRAIQFTPFLAPFRLADEEGQRVWGPSNNLSCRKAVFERVGGFDETFPNKPGGEDVDFGYRLYKGGHLLSTNPQAVIYHTTETWNTITQVVNRLFNWGQAEFYLYYNHGEYLHYDCPKGLGIFLIMIPTALVALTLNLDWKWLLLPLVFLVVNFSSRLILNFIHHPHHLNQSLKVITAESLILVYELGLTVQCLRKCWFLPLYNRLIILPEDAVMVWNTQILYTWVTFAQLLITIALVQSI